MKCGDKGHVTADGRYCEQPIATTAAGCIWHRTDAAGRRLMAMKGGIASRMRQALPASYEVPEFADTESILGFARELARSALIDNVDMRRLAEARGAATLALQVLQHRTQERLVDTLLRIEHGGPAFAMLETLKRGLAAPRRRSLPGGRMAASDATDDPDETDDPETERSQ